MASDNQENTEGHPGQELFAYRELIAPGTLGLAVTVALALITLYILLGPLDTVSLPWMQRIAIWSLAGTLNFITGYAGCVLTLCLVRSRPLAQVRLALAAMCVILAFPCMAVTYTVYGLFHDGTLPDVGPGRIYAFNLVFVFLLVALAHHVVRLRLRVKWLAATAEHTAGGRRAEAGSGEGNDLHEAASSDPHGTRLQQNRLFERLPEALGRDVIHVEVSGHYIRVTTTVGSAVTLMRFADAVDALGDSGMRIHRSYWVAYRHVTHLVRRDRHRRTLLRVTGDHELPVSRSFLPAVSTAVTNAHFPAFVQTIVIP